MKEYIEREAVLAREYIDFTRYDDTEWQKGYWAGVDDICAHVKALPAADVVPKAAFDQVVWERDVAIQQLREDYGVGLGEKKAADVVERKRGEWQEVSYWKYKNGHSIRYTAKRCSVCGADVGKKTQYNGCPYCFADMRSHHDSLCDQTEEGEHD